MHTQLFMAIPLLYTRLLWRFLYCTLGYYGDSFTAHSAIIAIYFTAHSAIYGNSSTAHPAIYGDSFTAHSAVIAIPLLPTRLL